MDAKPRPLPEVFQDLHGKFGMNLAAAAPYHTLAEAHECRARVIRQIGVLLGQSAQEEHQKLISAYFDEIFGDMVCSLYFFFAGLDVPGRMVLRRALELALVSISYWDSPAAFWAWNSKNKDISFTELEELLSGQGYAKFLETVGCPNTKVVAESMKELRKNFGILSNVVHPKPYNFETTSPTKFVFFEADLHVSLTLLRDVQVPLLKILFCRYFATHARLKSVFPNIDGLII